MKNKTIKQYGLNLLPVFEPYKIEKIDGKEYIIANHEKKPVLYNPFATGSYFDISENKIRYILLNKCKRLVKKIEKHSKAIREINESLLREANIFAGSPPERIINPLVWDSSKTKKENRDFLKKQREKEKKIEQEKEEEKKAILEFCNKYGLLGREKIDIPKVTRITSENPKNWEDQYSSEADEKKKEFFNLYVYSEKPYEEYVKNNGLSPEQPFVYMAEGILTVNLNTFKREIITIKNIMESLSKINDDEESEQEKEEEKKKKPDISYSRDEIIWVINDFLKGVGFGIGSNRDNKYMTTYFFDNLLQVIGILLFETVMSGKEIKVCAFSKCEDVFFDGRKDKRYCSKKCKKDDENGRRPTKKGLNP